MKTIIFNAKLAVYARQFYFVEATRGLMLILLVDGVIRLLIKRIERNHYRLAKQAVMVDSQ